MRLIRPAPPGQRYRIHRVTAMHTRARTKVRLLTKITPAVNARAPADSPARIVPFTSSIWLMNPCLQEKVARRKKQPQHRVGPARERLKNVNKSSKPHPGMRIMRFAHRQTSNQASESSPQTWGTPPLGFVILGVVNPASRAFFLFFFFFFLTIATRPSHRPGFACLPHIRIGRSKTRLRHHSRKPKNTVTKPKNSTSSKPLRRRQQCPPLTLFGMPSLPPLPLLLLPIRVIQPTAGPPGPAALINFPKNWSKPSRQGAGKTTRQPSAAFAAFANRRLQGLRCELSFTRLPRSSRLNLFPAGRKPIGCKQTNLHPAYVKHPRNTHV